MSVVMPPVVTTDFHKNALHARPGGGWFSNAQTAEQVAAAIVDLIGPKAKLYTDQGTAETVARYYADVGAFEENLGR